MTDIHADADGKCAETLKIQGNGTLDYYDRNAEDFAQSTLYVDFGETQERFLARLPRQGRILDFGCGAGRDAKYFLERGYDVAAVDGSGEMCRIAGAYAGIPVRQMQFEELKEADKYDGIWACASVLHLPKAELKRVLPKMERALRDRGVIYLSFKYGDFEGVRNGRYFTDFTEESFREFARGILHSEIEDCWVTGDVRPGRGEEKWLNLIFRKQIIS